MFIYKGVYLYIYMKTMDGCASLFLIVLSWLCLRLRRLGWWHRHRSPLADRHEGWRLSHWLLVQPRALLLEVQRNHFSGAWPLPPVAELGRANNRDVGGRSRFPCTHSSKVLNVWNKCHYFNQVPSSSTRWWNWKRFSPTYWAQTVITLKSHGILFSPDIFCPLLLTLNVSVCIPAGGAGLHHELPDVHFLGFTLLLLGRPAGEGLRTVRLRLRNTRGKTELCLMCFHVISTGKLQPAWRLTIIWDIIHVLKLGLQLLQCWCEHFFF